MWIYAGKRLAVWFQVNPECPPCAHMSDDGWPVQGCVPTWWLLGNTSQPASDPNVIQQKCSQCGTTKSHSRDGENWLSCSIRPDSSSSSSSSSSNTLNQHISKIWADNKMMRWHFQTALLHRLSHNNQLFNAYICWMTKTENETIDYEPFTPCSLILFTGYLRTFILIDHIYYDCNVFRKSRQLCIYVRL